MSALLEERAKQQRKGSKAGDNSEETHAGGDSNAASLKSLVESVKRKSAMSDEQRAKRRKL
jgi:hypothetical protein